MALWVVRHGEHLEDIAHRLGTTPEAIWDAPENASIRALRGTGAILRAGDVLVVPDAPEPRRASLRAGDTNAFSARVPKTTVTVRFRDTEGPLAGQPFTIDAEGQRIRGSSDGDGRVRFQVRVGTRRARLVFSRTHQAFDLELGALDPVATVSGAQMRLRHLGFYAGPLDGVLEGPTEDALRAFQNAEGLAASGGLDEATVAALGRAHGS